MCVCVCVCAYYAQGMGHYRLMMSNFGSVACGTDGNGFFTHNFYAYVWCFFPPHLPPSLSFSRSC